MSFHLVEKLDHEGSMELKKLTEEETIRSGTFFLDNSLTILSLLISLLQNLNRNQILLELLP